MFCVGDEEKDLHLLVLVKEFDDLTDQNILVKKEYTIETEISRLANRILRTKFIIYALLDEAWRMEAMLLVLRTQILVPQFDEGLDRMMGSLLGYSDDENNEFQSEAARMRLSP